MSDTDPPASRDGTQAVRRAAAILQRIAQVSEGAPPSLREISASVGLPRSTAHRILKCLADTGLVAYDADRRHYEVGPLCYELGLAVSERVLDMAPLCAAVDRVAARTNVTTYLMRRSGIHAVCIHKAEGNAVIRVIPVEVGQRRFLGVGAGATALLAALDDDAIERILGAIGSEFDRYADLSPDIVREAVAATRATGFSVSRSRAYRSVFGLGHAVAAGGSGAVGSRAAEFAISIAVHAPEVDEARIDGWKTVIGEEIARVSASSAG
ncbi:helix-turn-helix domain-containing protein [Rhodobacterales bacterium HKCCE2091]|nr:helix-turn-helix domain-containing protein [Rhodobacterales bacterium HKCCE2091]